MQAGKIASLLEKLSPIRYAAEWDNPGMNVGRSDNDVHKILVCLDADDEATGYAVRNGIDMIVSHHPLLFKGIKKINTDDITGRRILEMAENHINCYCMHTNYDTMGMADAAADRLELIHREVLSEICDGEGIGRVGSLKKPMTTGGLCELVKERFGLDKVVLYGSEEDIIRKAAICPGSGRDEIDNALRLGAEVIITGDITYHYGIDAVARGIRIIDAGHYGLEHIFIGEIGKYLRENTTDVEIIEMKINNPQKFV